MSLGAFFLDTSTRVRVDAAARIGTSINMERDLGLGDTDRFRADAYCRFAPRHKLRALYFQNRQSDSRQILDKEIVFRGTTYPLKLAVASRFDTTVTQVAYEYAFVQRERFQLAGSVGVHALKLKVGLSATGGSESASLSRSAAVDGPLPVVGLRGVWRITDRLYTDAQAQYFRLRIDPYEGRLADYAVSLVWQPSLHVGLGVGYNEFFARLDVSGNEYTGRLRWEYGGARAFVNFSW